MLITADTGYESIPSIVDTFQTTHNGNFVCYLIGHAHVDFVGTFENYPNQISIIQACSGGLGSWRDNSWTTWSEWAVRFNIVSVDYTMKYIRVYRVGEDYDRNMQHKVSMLLSYDKNVDDKFIL